MTKQKYYYTLKELKHEIYTDVISITTLQNLVRQNIIPTVRIAGRILVPAWWVEEQIELAIKKPINNLEKE